MVNHNFWGLKEWNEIISFRIKLAPPLWRWYGCLVELEFKGFWSLTNMYVYTYKQVWGEKLTQKLQISHRSYYYKSLALFHSYRWIIKSNGEWVECGFKYVFYGKWHYAFTELSASFTIIVMTCTYMQNALPCAKKLHYFWHYHSKLKKWGLYICKLIERKSSKNCYK